MCETVLFKVEPAVSYCYSCLPVCWVISLDEHVTFLSLSEWHNLFSAVLSSLLERPQRVHKLDAIVSKCFFKLELRVCLLVFMLLTQCPLRQIGFCFFEFTQILFEKTAVSDEMKDTICVYLTHHMHLRVFAYADWPLQPSGYWLSSNHRGLEWLRSPSYGAAQLAVDPGRSDPLQLLHICHPQMWVWKQCKHSASICSQHMLTPPESPLCLLWDSYSGVRAEAKTVSSCTVCLIWIFMMQIMRRIKLVCVLWSFQGVGCFT